MGTRSDFIIEKFWKVVKDWYETRQRQAGSPHWRGLWTALEPVGPGSRDQGRIFHRWDQLGWRQFGRVREGRRMRGAFRPPGGMLKPLMLIREVVTTS